MFEIELRREKGELYQIIRVKPDRNFNNKLGGMPCQSLCGHNYKRFHLTCMFCRLRRVYYGKMPSKIRVAPYMLLIWKDRKHSKIKNLLLKKLLTICELLAN